MVCFDVHPHSLPSEGVYILNKLKSNYGISAEGPVKSHTFASNYYYILLEEARKIPQATAFGSIHSLLEVL